MGVGRQVGLIDGDHGQAEPARDRGAVGAEANRAGQVDHLGAVPDQRVADADARQADPEARVAGQRHRGHPHDGVGERAWIRRVARRLRRDHERVMALLREQLGDPLHGMRDAIDIGRK